MTPEDVANKTLGWHKLAVAKLRERPELLLVVERNIARFKQNVSPRARHYFVEWEEHFRQGPEHLFCAALEESEHGDDLRQCSPFAGVLSNEERWEYFRQWRREYETRRA